MKAKSKILIYDIETAPNLSYVWGQYEQNVIEHDRQWYMLCWAAKWLGEKKVYTSSLPDYKLYKKDPENDKEVVLALWKMLNEADVVIAHNGVSFDNKKTNARLIAHDIKPPSPYKTVDTRLVAKRYFKFNSNRLDDLGDYLGVGRKIQTGGFELWKGCMEGDKKSWKKMLKYNRQDVKLLEEVYLKLRPWITSHPNRALLDEKVKSCPNCASTKLQRRGYMTTRVSKFQRWCCTNCGAWSRSRLAEKIDKPEIV